MATFYRETALSGDNRYKYQIRIDYGNPDAAYNRTSISWKSFVRKDDSVWDGKWTNDPDGVWDVWANGVKRGGGSKGYNFQGNGDVYQDMGSGSYWLNHDVSGNATVTVAGTFTDNGATGLGSARVEYTHALPKINRLGYLSAYNKGYRIGDGLNYKIATRSNGLTYQIAIYEPGGTVALAGFRTVSANVDTYLKLTDAEKAKIYEFLTNSGGDIVWVFLRTYSGSTQLGQEVYKDSKAMPDPVRITSEDAFLLGQNIPLTWAKNSTALNHEVGLTSVDPIRWLGTFPDQMATNVSQHTIDMNRNDRKYGVMALNPAAQKHQVRLFVRQKNAKGADLGTANKIITLTIPAITMKTNIRPGLTTSEIDLSFAGNITPIDRIEYSKNGGVDWHVVNTASLPEPKLTHVVKGLVADGSYDYEYRFKQAGTTNLTEHGPVKFKNKKASTLNVYPLDTFTDGELTVTTTKDTGVRNAVVLRRMKDVKDIRHVYDAPATFNHQLKAEDYDSVFGDDEFLILRVYLNMHIDNINGGALQQQVYKDVKITQNGSLYVKNKDGNWVSAMSQHKIGAKYVRGVPHVLRNNLFPEVGWNFKAPYWIDNNQGVVVDVQSAPYEAFEEGYYPNLIFNANFDRDEGYTTNRDTAGYLGRITRIKRWNEFCYRFRILGINEDRWSQINGWTSKAVPYEKGKTYTTTAWVYIDDLSTISERGIWIGIQPVDSKGSWSVFSNGRTYTKSMLKRGWNEISLENFHDPRWDVDANDITSLIPKFQVIQSGDLVLVRWKMARHDKVTPFNIAWADIPEIDKPIKFIRTRGGSHPIKLVCTPLENANWYDATFLRTIKIRNVGTKTIKVYSNQADSWNDALPDGVTRVLSKQFKWSSKESNVQINFRGAVSDNFDFYVDDLQLIDIAKQKNWIQTKR